VPIGAVIVVDGAVVADGFNQPISSTDPTAHAEIVALRRAAAAAGKLSPGRLRPVRHGGAVPDVRGRGLQRADRSPGLRSGRAEVRGRPLLLRAEELRLNHRFEVVAGVREEECRALMVEFFRGKRSAT